MGVFTWSHRQRGGRKTCRNTHLRTHINTEIPHCKTPTHSYPDTENQREKETETEKEIRRQGENEEEKHIHATYTET